MDRSRKVMLIRYLIKNFPHKYKANYEHNGNLVLYELFGVYKFPVEVLCTGKYTPVTNYCYANRGHFNRE